MGLESANYMFIPAGNRDDVLRVLEKLGATIQPASGLGLPLVLHESTFWIDILLIDSLTPETASTQVSIRVALSNPFAVEKALQELMGELLARIGGRIYDSQTRTSFSTMTEDTWVELIAELRKKRAFFQEHFGPFEAAISGADVFKTLRAIKRT